MNPSFYLDGAALCMAYGNCAADTSYPSNRLFLVLSYLSLCTIAVYDVDRTCICISVGGGIGVHSILRTRLEVAASCNRGISVKSALRWAGASARPLSPPLDKAWECRSRHEAIPVFDKDLQMEHP